jgi:hypothetical protein
VRSCRQRRALQILDVARDRVSNVADAEGEVQRRQSFGAAASGWPTSNALRSRRRVVNGRVICDGRRRLGPTRQR